MGEWCLDFWVIAVTCPSRTSLKCKIVLKFLVNDPQEKTIIGRFEKECLSMHQIFYILRRCWWSNIFFGNFIILLNSRDYNVWQDVHDFATAGSGLCMQVQVEERQN
jgi:hypothetical protein